MNVWEILTAIGLTGLLFMPLIMLFVANKNKR